MARMKFKFLYATLILTGYCLVLSTAHASRIKMEIKENQILAIGSAQKSLLVKFKNSTDWEPFYEDIKGFNYEEGYRYTLIVKRKKMKKPAEGFTYILRRVIHKEKIINEETSVNVIAKINAKKWYLRSIKDTPVLNIHPYMVLDLDKNSFSGFGGCNNFSGALSYNKAEKTLSFDQLISTKMYCSENNASDIEFEFTSALNMQSLTFSFTDQNLTFFNKGNKVLEFVKEEEKNKWDFISSYKWNLIQINGENPEKADVHIIFDAKENRVYGSSGCNRYFGGYTTTGNQLHFSKIASTLMACMNERLNKLESDFTGLLNSENLTFDIADQTLNIYKDNQLVLMFGMTSLEE